MRISTKIGIVFDLDENGNIIFNGRTYTDFAKTLAPIAKQAIMFGGPRRRDDVIDIEQIPYPIVKKLDEFLETIFKESINQDFEKMDAHLLLLKDIGLIQKKYDTLQNGLKLTLKNIFDFSLNFDKLYKASKQEAYAYNSIGSGSQDYSQKTAEFIDAYFKSEINDFSFFRDMLQEFGVTDEAKILEYYNDNIDASYDTNVHDFAAHAKKRVMDLQTQIIEDAVASGLLPPSDLPRFANPKDDVNKEKINPKKIEMLKHFNFTDAPSDKILTIYDADGNLTEAARFDISKKYKEEMKSVTHEISPNIHLFNLFAVRDNNLSYSKLLDWAKFSTDNNFLSPIQAYSLAISAVRHANRLSDCGILTTTDGKNFQFTSKIARQVLFENYKDGYNLLADSLIKAYNVGAPEEQKDGFVYSRVAQIDFKKESTKIEKLWKTVQDENRKSDSKEISRQFINISAVRFNKISVSSLESWKEQVIKNKALTEEQAESFIAESLKQASRLKDMGIMTEEKTGEFKFLDDYAKEVLYKNFNAKNSFLAALAPGLKIPIAPIDDQPIIAIEIIPDVFEAQKQEYKEILKNQFISYYQPMNHDFQEFKQDVLNNEGDELYIYLQYSELRKAGQDLSSFQNLTSTIVDEIEKEYVEAQDAKKIDPDLIDEFDVKKVLDDLYSFNFYYMMSSDSNYKKNMEKLESSLMSKIQILFYHNTYFANKVKEFLEKSHSNSAMVQAFKEYGFNPYSRTIDFNLGEQDLSSIATHSQKMKLIMKVSNYMLSSGLRTHDDNLRLHAIAEWTSQDKQTLGEVVSKLNVFIEEFDKNLFERANEQAVLISKIVATQNENEDKIVQ